MPKLPSRKTLEVNFLLPRTRRYSSITLQPGYFLAFLPEEFGDESNIPFDYDLSDRRFQLPLPKSISDVIPLMGVSITDEQGYPICEKI